MSFSLIKIAISYEAAKETITARDIAKKIKGQTGKDISSNTSEMDSLLDFFIYVLTENLPADIPEKMKGTAVLFIKREMFKEMVATISGDSHEDGRADIYFPEFSHGLAHRPIEDFGRLSKYLPRYNATYYQNLQDLMSFDDLSHLLNVLVALEEYENEDLAKRHGPRWAESLRPKAIQTTKLLKGDHDTALVPPKDLNEYSEDQDLVNGKFNRAEWIILVPDSVEAARYWGYQTDWCTAHPLDKHNFYNHYSKNGKLFIFINNRTGHRYQFHFASKQYNNMYDVGIKNSRLLAGLTTMLREHVEESDEARQDIPGPLKLMDMISESRYGQLEADSRLLSKPDEDGLISSTVTPDGELPSVIHQVGKYTVIAWTKDSNYHRTDGPALITISTESEMRYFTNGSPSVGPQGWSAWETKDLYAEGCHYFVNNVTGGERIYCTDSGYTYGRDQHEVWTHDQKGQVKTTSDADRKRMDRMSKMHKDGFALLQSETIRWTPIMANTTKNAAPKFTLIKSPEPEQQDALRTRDTVNLHDRLVREHAMAQKAATELADRFAPTILKRLMLIHDADVMCDEGSLTVPGLALAEQCLDEITDTFVPMEIPSGSNFESMQRYDPDLLTKVRALLDKGYWTDAIGDLRTNHEIFVYDTETFYKELFLDLDKNIQRHLIDICS